MNTQELAVRDEVRLYVEGVRAALADLAPDVVDDLTGGLEADLTDTVAESAGSVRNLPSPSAYAAELRSAAGLPDRGGRPTTVRWWEHDVVPAVTATWNRARSENAWLDRAAVVAEELRPAGWVARGLVLAALVGAVFGLVHAWIPLGLLFVVASVWAGRSRRQAGQLGRLLLVAASTLAVVGGLPAYWFVANSSAYSESVNVSDYVGPGMVFNGDPVGNLYLYDADGNRLRDVRAFDEKGRPLDLSNQLTGPDGNSLPGVVDRYGTAWHNVVPVTADPSGDPWAEVDGNDGRWNAPRVIAPLDAPASDPSATAPTTPSPTTGGSPAPTTGASPTPTRDSPSPSTGGTPSVSTGATPRPTK